MTNYIGIDVGKTHFECFIPETGETNKITNNKKGFAKLLKHIDKCYKNKDLKISMINLLLTINLLKLP